MNSDPQSDAVVAGSGSELRHKGEREALHGSADLVNRRDFELRLQRVLDTVRTGQVTHALCYLRLEHVKVVSDTSFAARVELLRSLATLFKEKVRDRDTLARLRGETFGLLMEHCSLPQARRAANELRRAVQELRFQWGGKSYGFGVSIGLVPIAETTDSVHALMAAAEAALRESEGRFRNLIETAIQGIFIHQDFKPVFVNQACANILGYESPDAILAMESVLPLFAPHERDRAQRCKELLLKEGAAPTRCEFEATRKDGLTITIEVLMRLVPWEGDRAFHALVIDTTERKREQERAKRHQEELAHVARLSIMGEMASGLAHELNQPLAAITTYSQTSLRIVRSGDISSQKLVHALEQTTLQAKRASEIIRRIRDFVRKGDTKKSDVCLNEVVREAVAFAETDAREKGIAVRLELAEGLPCVSADRIQIEQVLLNLLRNGIEAMSVAEPGPHELIVRSCLVDDDTVQVTVRDTGPGLDTQTLSHAFDPFYTTKADGMGMGLAICQSIIEAHGGDLWSTSESAHGGVFHFTLRISPGGPSDGSPGDSICSG